MSQRFSQTSLESQSNIPNVAILTQASEPTKPDFPDLLLNLSLAIFCGTLLGVGLAFILEIFDPRVRTPWEFEQTIETPAARRNSASARKAPTERWNSCAARHDRKIA